MGVNVVRLDLEGLANQLFGLGAVTGLMAQDAEEMQRVRVRTENLE